MNFENQRLDTYDDSIRKLDAEIKALQEKRNAMCDSKNHSEFVKYIGDIFGKVYLKTFSDSNNFAYAIYTKVTSMRESSDNKTFTIKGLLIYLENSNLKIYSVNIEYGSKAEFEKFNTEVLNVSEAKELFDVLGSLRSAKINLLDNH